MIEIKPVGGYSEVGRNCVLVKYKEETVMLDFGLEMENYIRLSEDESVPRKIPKAMLMREGAIPDINPVKDDLKKLKAVCVSHAHLDHVGGLPYLLDDYSVPVHATEFTIKVLENILDDKGVSHKDLHSHPSNSRFKISDNLEIEFIHVTHSTPQTVIIVVHTPEGSVLYANDFRLDDTPMLGKPPNYAAMENVENPRALIMDSLYSLKDVSNKSETFANEELKKILLQGETKNKNIVVTTFASHVERIKMLIDIADELGRTPVFLGRSLHKYLSAAKAAGIEDFSKYTFVKSGRKTKTYFENMKKTKDKLFIATGHQGEPKAILSRMTKENIFPFEKDDIVVFSCKIIPIEQSYKNREVLEEKLEKKGVQIFTDVHVSGHAARKDHKRMIELIKPEHIVPTHGTVAMLESQKDLAVSLGYDPKKVHLLTNYSSIYLK